LEENFEKKIDDKELRRIELFQELYEYVKPINNPEFNSNYSTVSEHYSPINKEFNRNYEQETYSKFMSRHYFSQEIRD
jgi:hypothetical protein